jgi:hypothetical protein
MNDPLPKHHADGIGVGAPEEEVEVTPAMTTVGVVHLFDYDPQFSNEEEVVEKMFKAMIRARTEIGR